MLSGSGVFLCCFVLFLCCAFMLNMMNLIGDPAVSRLL